MAERADLVSPPAAADEQLSVLRRRIDAANEEILRAIERRGALVLRIGRVKRKLGAAAVDPQREVEMLARVAALVRGPFPRADIQKIFQAIVLASRALQAPGERD